jgi:nanoRNase/pAp phosphatase (c-di-AMP/oligoRNAs hydrolase)
VNRVANVFGGGGHKNAAGCTLNGSYATCGKESSPSSLAPFRKS